MKFFKLSLFFINFYVYLSATSYANEEIFVDSNGTKKDVLSPSQETKKSSSPFDEAPLPELSPMVVNNFNQIDPTNLNTNNNSPNSNVQQFSIQNPAPIVKNNIQKIEEPEKKINIKKIMGNNYKNFISPQEYYQSEFNKQNSHLPPVYFKSYHNHLAFNSVEKNNIDALRYFIKNNNVNNLSDVNGNNLLIHAVKFNNSDAVRLLLMNKFNVNYQNRDGKTALHLSVINNNYEISKVLLTFGADINLTDNNNMSAFSYAEKTTDNRIFFLLSNYYSRLSLNK